MEQNDNLTLGRPERGPVQLAPPQTFDAHEDDQQASPAADPALETNDLAPATNPEGKRPGSAKIPAHSKPETPTPGPVEDRHSRKCKICHHPDRELIEQDYLDWLNPYRVAEHHGLPARALYRHFHAVGLASERRENLRLVLDRIIERGAETAVTGDVIIRAIRAQCCLTDRNEWIEPARHVVYSNQPAATQESQFLIDTETIRT
jgi:hypothetical protein